MITMEDGLQMMRRAFPDEKKLFISFPMLCSVFTGCKKVIHFCLVCNVGKMYFVREIISGRAYKTAKLRYREMNVGESHSNMTVTEQNGNPVVKMIKSLNT